MEIELFYSAYPFFSKLMVERFAKEKLLYALSSIPDSVQDLLDLGRIEHWLAENRTFGGSTSQRSNSKVPAFLRDPESGQNDRRKNSIGMFTLQQWR